MKVRTQPIISQTIRIIDLRTGKSAPIAFPEPVYSVFLDTNPEFETTTLRYRYQSLTTPSSVFDYDMEKHAGTLRKRFEVPHYDASRMASERFVYPFAAQRSSNRSNKSSSMETPKRLSEIGRLIFFAKKPPYQIKFDWNRQGKPYPFPAIGSSREVLEP